MIVTATTIADVMLLEPTLLSDERGYFYESFNAQRFAELTGVDIPFVQDNHSSSHRHVLRGLHFQASPHAQGKLVRVTSGEIFDVVVDLRPGSPTRGRWMSAILSGENRRQLWIPPGLAHGFLTLSAHAEVLYKTNNYWSAAHERSIRWDDPSLAIAWPLTAAPIISAKDQAAGFFNDLG